jgi:exosortase D (VPLPA-CTERM-specific)
MSANVTFPVQLPVDWFKGVWPTYIGLVIGSLVFLFHEAFEVIATYWQQPEYSHGWLIPIITLFCLWRRRDKIRAARTTGDWAGVAIVVLGLVLLVLTLAALSGWSQVVAFVITLGGLGLATLGRRSMRFVWLPLAFLLFALPLPGSSYVLLSTKLQLVSSQLGAWMLQALGISVFLDGNVIDLGTFKLQVAEACSGLRYLFPLSAFGFLCAWLYRAPLWAKAIVFLATIPITVITNSARIALTGVLMDYGSQELAQGFLHLFEGWIIFLVALAFLFALMLLLARLRDPAVRVIDLLDFDRFSADTRVVPTGGRGSVRLGAPALMCALLLAVTLPTPYLLSARSEVIPARPGLLTFPLRLGPWEGQAGAVDDETLSQLGADDYLLADFRTPAAKAPVNFWVAYYGSQIRGRWTHSPQECLPSAGWEFARLDVVQSPALNMSGASFPIYRAVISRGSERMLMYYWYEQRGAQVTDSVAIRLSILKDALTKHRSDGALVRVLTPIMPDENTAMAEQRLIDFVRAAYPALEPHVGA